ncbi:PAS domain-containing protein [Pseudoalteromonas sp. MMG024]|uniref:PAS domain-containing protein n=1 Tax=Pseudoalteromonas sp. MMG024 TaxID=2909980 RepID=UPI001F199409|nr:PAS domain-containing protein [Pseudoalteromonas sp. MMG024]MCF6455562.1 PAS domain-containing protein [Pseudoalteromonas sp. MMG024]
MKPDFLLINKYKLYLLIFLIYVIACIALAYWFASQLQQKQSEQWQFQLSSFSKAIVSKSDYVENLISGIASLYSASSNASKEHVKPLIDDQINGLAFDSSIEFYYRLTPSNVEFVEDYMQQVGAFDFTISDSISFSNQYENYVLLANYPESDFGHLVGSTISINNDSANAFIVKEWLNSEFWSVILNTADVKTVSLRFNIKSFFDYIHASGDTQNQHITISVGNQAIYNSDWQNSLGLSSIEPLAQQRIPFFDKTLDIAYFNPSYVRHSHYLISAGLCTLAILFGFALFMYLVTIRNQYAHINRLVRIKTYSLKKTQQNLAATSQLKVKALEQQLETKKKYKTLFVNCSEGLFCCNDKGYILEKNPAFIDLLLPDDANNNICGLMSEKQKALFLACQNNQFANELFVQNKLGKTYCLLLKGHWVKDAERTLFDGRLLDITATKQHEEKLRY